MKQNILIAIIAFFSFTSHSIAQQEVKVGLQIGNKAPEIAEKSVDGKDLKLSSLEGKMVLIDFWASWCGPCRRENPTVVAAYNDFKDRKFKKGNGFTVFSVSLDKAKEPWVKAIQTDKLIWNNHVSDLKGWYSKYAAVYGVRSIPSNLLIDGNGVIIAKNLRGPVLKNTLTQLLK